MDSISLNKTVNVASGRAALLAVERYAEHTPLVLAAVGLLAALCARGACRRLLVSTARPAPGQARGLSECPATDSDRQLALATGRGGA